MAEENKNGNSFGGANNGKGAAPPLRLWLVCFSFTAVSFLFGAVFFQLQLVSLRREMASLGIGPTGCETERTGSLVKRSAESERDEAERGIRSAHFRGANPLQHVKKRGKIGPWATPTTCPDFVVLTKKSTEIEISKTGLYHLYAQICYLTSEAHNSFQIISYNGTEPRENRRRVATCAAPGPEIVGEASCYTAFTGNFRSGERLYLHQIEQNRIVHFADGSSYFGVILLKENTSTKSAPKKKF